MQCEKCKYKLIHKNPEVSRLDELKCLSAQKNWLFAIAVPQHLNHYGRLLSNKNAIIFYRWMDNLF